MAVRMTLQVYTYMLRTNEAPRRNFWRSLQRQAAAKERSATKKLRSIQRQAAAKIMEVNCSDTKLFHGIIRSQRRKGIKLTDRIVIDDVHYETPDLIVDAWAIYFSKLATANSSNPSKHSANIELNLMLIHDILSTDTSLTEVTEETVSRIIKQFKSDKAPDELGVTTEHLAYGGQLVISIATRLINGILSHRRLPNNFKSGIITPI